MPTTTPEDPAFFETRMRNVLLMLESTVGEVRSVLDHFVKGEEDPDAPDHQDAG